MKNAKQFEKEKQTFIKSWNNHANDFYSLAFCSNETLSKEIVDCIKKIQENIPKIADTKKSFNGVSK